MIFLESDTLEIRFPELHEKAGVEITFQRTLRIPDKTGPMHFLRGWVVSIAPHCGL